MFPLSYTNIISGSFLNIQNIVYSNINRNVHFIILQTLWKRYFWMLSETSNIWWASSQNISEKKKPFMKNVLHYNIFVLLFWEHN